MSETRESTLLEGIITRDGILCNYCDKILNALDFEIHAGSVLKRSYENIFKEELRISLLSCMRGAWERVGKIGGHKLKKIEAKYSSCDKLVLFARMGEICFVVKLVLQRIIKIVWLRR